MNSPMATLGYGDTSGVAMGLLIRGFEKLIRCTIIMCCASEPAVIVYLYSTYPCSTIRSARAGSNCFSFTITPLSGT